MPEKIIHLDSRNSDYLYIYIYIYILNFHIINTVHACNGLMITCTAEEQVIIILSRP